MDLKFDDKIINTDYVFDGDLYVDPCHYNGNVIVTAETDLALISAIGYYKPGAMAHTDGWANVWELGADGSTWTAMN